MAEPPEFRERRFRVGTWSSQGGFNGPQDLRGAGPGVNANVAPDVVDAVSGLGRKQMAKQLVGFFRDPPPGFRYQLTPVAVEM